MEWLNYHHLLYFWAVAKEGSVVAASEVLRLAHPTISGQIHQLERNLGEKLFVRRGRNLALTEVGQIAFRYADEIFSLGREFQGIVRGSAKGRPIRLVVGVSNFVPKPIVHRILEPVFELDDPIQLVCREDRSTEAFMGELAVHGIDVVLSDAPARPVAAVRPYSHQIGECGTVLLASAKLASSLGARSPGNLDGAPFLLPSTGSILRWSLEEWFATHKIRPRVVAELDDSALAETFGEAGLGIFAAPSIVEAEIRRRSRVRLVARLDKVKQRFYVISIERKIRHPAVVAIREAARENMFH
ncbi:MAG: transcriptional activator NhaR [bacterium]